VTPQSAGGAGGGGAARNGPDGSNLFIYHIPASWGDSDLMASFAPFGNVVSATAMKDKVTGVHQHALIEP
jgi:hypothetical protein